MVDQAVVDLEVVAMEGKPLEAMEEVQAVKE